MPCLGNRCNNSLLECFTKVFVFLKDVSMFLKVVLEVVFVKCVLKVGKCVLQV